MAGDCCAYIVQYTPNTRLTLFVYQSKDSRGGSIARAGRVYTKRYYRETDRDTFPVERDGIFSVESESLAAVRTRNSERGIAVVVSRLQSGVSFDVDADRFVDHPLGGYLPSAGMSLKTHSRLARAFSLWRRVTWRRREMHRRDADAKVVYPQTVPPSLEKGRFASRTEVETLCEETLLLLKVAERESAFSHKEMESAGDARLFQHRGGSIGAAAVAAAAARRGARLDLAGRGKRRLELLCEKKQFVDVAVASPINRREITERHAMELERKRHDAAVCVQKHVRGLFSRNDASKLKGKRDAYARERVAGLRYGLLGFPKSDTHCFISNAGDCLSIHRPTRD